MVMGLENFLKTTKKHLVILILLIILTILIILIILIILSGLVWSAGQHLECDEAVITSVVTTEQTNNYPIIEPLQIFC